LLRRLNLTEEQADKVQDILKEARSQAESARDAHADAVEALEDAVAEGADKEEIRKAAGKLGEAIADGALHRVQVLASIKEVLTEEQREQLERMKDRIGRFQHGSPGAPGPWGRGGRMSPGFGRGQQGPAPMGPGGRGRSGQRFRGGPGAGQGPGDWRW
jgi:hypothetical protein